MSKQYPDISTRSGGTVTTVYDRSVRSWCTQLRDSAGFQVGEAQYDGNRDSLECSRKFLTQLGGGAAEPVTPATQRKDAQLRSALESFDNAYVRVKALRESCEDKSTVNEAVIGQLHQLAVAMGEVVGTHQRS